MPTDPAINAARRLNSARKAALEMRQTDPDLAKVLEREQRAFAALMEARPTTLRGACAKINEALGFLDSWEGAENASLFARTAREALGGRDPQGWGVEALECAMMLAAHHCGEEECPTVLLRSALEGLKNPHAIEVKLSSHLPLTPHVNNTPRRRVPSLTNADMTPASGSRTGHTFTAAEERVG